DSAQQRRGGSVKIASSTMMDVNSCVFEKTEQGEGANWYVLYYLCPISTQPPQSTLGRKWNISLAPCSVFPKYRVQRG
ncbi:hypothetical protein CY34DRAFT_810790, partial [Suillus luteus UH-Slu-Lm8-n1]